MSTNLVPTSQIKQMVEMSGSTEMSPLPLLPAKEEGSKGVFV